MIFLDAMIEKKAIAVLKAYPDKNFSFCDACSFALIDHKKMRDVYTLDRKDFQVYKFKRKLNFIDAV